MKHENYASRHTTSIRTGGLKVLNGLKNLNELTGVTESDVELLNLEPLNENFRS